MLNLATPSLAPLESASTRPASMPGFVPDDAHGPSGLSRRGGPGASERRRRLASHGCQSKPAPICP